MSLVKFNLENKKRNDQKKNLGRGKSQANEKCTVKQLSTKANIGPAILCKQNHMKQLNLKMFYIRVLKF